MYYTYLLRCEDGSIYTGITTNLSRRLSEHLSGINTKSAYTRLRHGVRFEIAFESENRSLASRLEYVIKSLSRSQKEKIIEGKSLGSIAGRVDISDYRLAKELAMTQKERMLAGLAYKAEDPELRKEYLENKKRVHEYNAHDPLDLKWLDRSAREILGGAGKNLTMCQPVHFDYGRHTYVGDNFFSNYNLCVLDVADVVIGDNVFIAPNVSIYTAGHPLHPDSRNSMYEYGIGITIGDNCWIGGSVTICPGVHIGAGCVIGAGSVVVKDIPPYSLAVGNPCRVVREITEEDRDFYFKDKKFDVDDYK